jgi:imidazolonepropionase-like amidohydrolase
MTDERPVAIVADRVWDGVSPRPIEHGFVRVAGGVIDAVGPASELPSDAERRDLGDVTLLPGLINAHVHITFCASTTVLDDYFRERDAGFETLMKRAAENLRRAISVGCTTVRDLGTLNPVVFAAREAVRDGTLVGPDIVAAGEGITSNGGHCYFFGIEAEGEDAVRAAVQRQHAAGADVVKIFATGGNLTPGTDPFSPQYSAGELRTCVDTARALGLPVASHAHATEGIRRSVAAGVNTIEHCFFETPDGLDFDEHVAAEMASKQIAAVPTHGVSLMRYLADPTLVDDLPPERQVVIRRILSKIPQAMRNFARMRELGVPIVSGTDAGIPNRHFDDFAADLTVLAEDGIGIGMGARAALMAATSENARMLGLDDRGSLVRSKRADLLAVAGNPLEHIEDVQQTRFVMSGGRVALDVGEGASDPGRDPGRDPG